MAIIVVSILLAFWVDATWQDRQARRVEADILSAVSAESRENQEALEEVTALLRRDLYDLDRFLSLPPGEFSGMAPDSVGIVLLALGIAHTFDPSAAAANLLADAEVLESRGIRIRTSVARWLRSVADAEEERDKLNELSTVVWTRMARHAVGADPQSRAIPRMLATAPPEVWDRIATDAGLAEAVINKRQMQWVYLGQLELAAEELGRLIEDLDRTNE